MNDYGLVTPDPNDQAVADKILGVLRDLVLATKNLSDGLKKLLPELESASQIEEDHDG